MWAIGEALERTQGMLEDAMNELKRLRVENEKLRVELAGTRSASWLFESWKQSAENFLAVPRAAADEVGALTDVLRSVFEAGVMAQQQVDAATCEMLASSTDLLGEPGNARDCMIAIRTGLSPGEAKRRLERNGNLEDGS